mmetsp:Transcript_38085/g.101502  ORF Transcript_38085/g.101502 Transcript_38085/m.101502 type:complete len:248 (+) Transcript_38085:302-1045(+)
MSNFNTSHQSMPPDTAINNVRTAIGRDPKKSRKDSTFSSVSPASEMYCETALMKTTEKENMTRKRIVTAHISMVLQFMIATDSIRSLLISPVNRISLSMRTERITRTSRRMRRKLGLKPMAIKNISPTHRKTMRVSKRFHFHSGPLMKLHSRATTRSDNSTRKTALKMRSTATDHPDWSMSAYCLCAPLLYEFMELFTDKSLMMPMNSAFRTMTAATENLKCMLSTRFSARTLYLPKKLRCSRIIDF